MLHMASCVIALRQLLAAKGACCPSATLALLSLGKLQKAGLQSLVIQPLPLPGNGGSGICLPLCLSTETPKSLVRAVYEGSWLLFWP